MDRDRRERPPSKPYPPIQYGQSAAQVTHEY